MWLKAVLVLAALAPPVVIGPAPEAPPKTIVIRPERSAPDGSTTYLVVSRHVDQLQGLDLTLEFPLGVSPGSVATTTITKGCVAVAHPQGDIGLVTIGLACPLPVTGSGPLVTFGLTKKVPVRIIRCLMNEEPCD